jgi:transcriptional regulator with XRE-family HTH domain
MSEEAEVEAELPLDSVGARLLRAREASGMSRAQLAAITKIPERHLTAIESGDFAALPARTYAVGFSRSYAKALGLDEKEIVEAVRSELADQEPPPLRGLPAFEPGDPARVPGARFAWFAALAALAVVVAGFAFAWRSYYLPGGTLPSILLEESAAPAAVPGTAAPSPAVGPGPVVFTAEQAGIWVKFYDANGTQLLQKQLALGETWTVPDNAGDVKIWTARPEALAISVGGKPVPRLADVQKTVKDVSVTAAALLARGTSAAPAAVPTPAPRAPVDAAQARSRSAVAPRARNQPSLASPTPEPSASPSPAAIISPSPPPA